VASPEEVDERLKVRWLKEYSLSFGLLFCIAAVVLVQYRTVMVALLTVGLAFLLLSMVFAVREPPRFR
jgi:hypothetical protein